MESNADYLTFSRSVEHSVTTLVEGHYNFMSTFVIKRPKERDRVLMNCVCVPDLADRPVHVRRAIMANTAKRLTEGLWDDYAQWQHLNRAYPGVRGKKK